MRTVAHNLHRAFVKMVHAVVHKVMLIVITKEIFD